MAGTYVRVEWSVRKETLPNACLLMESFLVMLSTKHQLLSHWYALGSSKAQALRSPLPTTSTELAPMVIARAKMKDANAEIPLEGLALSGWNGKDDDQSASFSVNIGSTSQWVKNTALVELPVLNEEDTQRLQSDLIAALREWGRPDRVVVNGQAI